MENTPQHPIKLLIVDDEEGIVYYTKKIFEKRGFRVFGATDGIAAVEIFKKERPSVSLIDVHMPYSPIDGIETLKRIKDIDKDALCIIVTYITENYAVDACRKLGAAAYLLKPLEPQELEQAVSEVANIKF